MLITDGAACREKKILAACVVGPPIENLYMGVKLSESTSKRFESSRKKKAKSEPPKKSVQIPRHHNAKTPGKKKNQCQKENRQGGGRVCGTQRGKRGGLNRGWGGGHEKSRDGSPIPKKKKLTSQTTNKGRRVPCRCPSAKPTPRYSAFLSPNDGR